MQQCVGHLTFLKKSLGKIVMGRPIFGPEIHSGLKSRNGFVYLPASQENYAQVVISDIIVCRHCKGVGPERFAVAPKGSLIPRAPGQSAEQNRGSNGCNLPLVTP